MIKMRTDGDRWLDAAKRNKARDSSLPRRVRLGSGDKRIRETISIWKSGCMVTVTEQRLDPKQFGEVLRYHREGIGVSLREMARRSKISAPHLSDCELGRRSMSDEALMRWGRAYLKA